MKDEKSLAVMEKGIELCLNLAIGSQNASFNCPVCNALNYYDQDEGEARLRCRNCKTLLERD